MFGVTEEANDLHCWNFSKRFQHKRGVRGGTLGVLRQEDPGGKQGGRAARVWGQVGGRAGGL